MSDRSSTARPRAARPRAGRRGRLVGALLGLVVALGMLASAEPASAHAVLVSSSPRDGSRLAASPARVTLTFDERVQLVPDTARVISGGGDRADRGSAHLDPSGRSVVIPLRPRLPRGSYTATWRVVSADSHIVSGSIAFGVRQDAAAVAESTTPPPDALDIVADAAQGLGYLGIVLLLGLPGTAGALWPSALRRRRVRVLAVIGGAVVLAGALVQLLLQGPRATGSGWAGAGRLDDLGQTLTSLDGVALAVRVVLAAAATALAAIALRDGRVSRPGWIAGGALGAAVLATIALDGHSAAGTDVAVAIPVAVLHLAAMCVWLGGLLGLLIAVLPRLGRMPRFDPRRLRRWSLTAFVAVGVLILSGEYQALREVQPVEALWQTSYGITLLVKLGLVLVAIVAAVLAQRVVAARTGRSGRTPVRRVRRSVAVEAVAVIAVVAVTTVLVSLPPTGSTYGPAAHLSARLGPDTLRVAVASTRRGPQRITATAVDRAGRVVRLEALDASLSSAQAGVAALDIRFRERPDGSWRSTDATAPIPAEWTLTFQVSLDQAAGYATSTSYRVW